MKSRSILLLSCIVFALSLCACPPDPPPTEPTPCQLGAPQVAGTAATDALANAPGRCGIAPYRWLRSSRLGEVLATGAQVTYDPAVLELGTIVGDIQLPRPPRYEAQVDQILYLTQDRGELIEATALVGYPLNASEKREFDIVLILHGTSGFKDGCGPSDDDGGRQLVGLFASLGMVAVAPDYIGLKNFGAPTGFLHPYLIGEATAMASLDAVRAAARVLAWEQPNRCLHPRVAVMGGSQGGHAALWVDRLAPYYAREIELVGGVATVPPADLLAEVNRALRETVDASGNTAVMLAAAADWYGYADRLNEVFVDGLDPTVAEAMAAECDPSDQVVGMTIQDLFAPALLQAVSDSAFHSYQPWSCIVETNSLVQTDVQRLTPQPDSYGILYVLGENDPLVHTPIERESFDKLCDQGMRLQFLECAGANHTEATAWSYPEIFNFIDARFAGEPLATGADLCQRSAPQICSATPEP